MSVAQAARDSFRLYATAVKDTFYDRHMRSIVELYGRSNLNQDLTQFGEKCAKELDTMVRETNHVNKHPRLESYDGFGNKIEKINFPEEYHAIGRVCYRSGIMANYADKGREFESLVQLYLMAQNGETGHSCPIACTSGLIKSLQAEPQTPQVQAWLAKLLSPDYDKHYHGSQFLSEVQGGSDVGANTLSSKPSATHPGMWELTGEKWFCSAVDAQLWLVVARPEGAEEGTRGLRTYIVPRNISENQVNNFRVRRLKYKLGTCTMASGELDFHGTIAHQLTGDFKKTLGLVINTSRLYNAVSCAAIVQRCYREAAAYACYRKAFGTRLVDFPAVKASVAQLNCEAHGARAVCFFLADFNDKNTEQGPAVRMLVNLNKYWTADVGLRMTHEAIDVLGGNGAIEEFSVLPRLLRDSVVLAQWEGPHNTLCAQALKDCNRLGLHKPMFEFLRTLGSHPRLDEVERDWTKLLTLSHDLASLGMRPLVDELRNVVQYLLLTQEYKATGDRVTLAAAEHLIASSAPGYSAIRDPMYLERLNILSHSSQGLQTGSKL